MTLFIDRASAQNMISAVVLAPNSGDVTENTADTHASWTESLGEPSVYVQHAREDVNRKHYKAAARNLRTAARILEENSKNAYGLDQRRLTQDIVALRLTARDVAVGAIRTPEQLDSVLDVIHARLRDRINAVRS